MFLIYGVLVLFALVLFWSAALRLCRRPDPGWYGREFMQAYFWAPVGASGLLVGVLMIAKGAVMFSPSILELALSAVILALAVAMYRWLNKGVPQAETSGTRTKPTIIPFGAKHRAKSQAQDSSDPREQEFKKAA